MQLGQKKFIIDKDDPNQFVLVSSVTLRQQIIDKNLFERSEVFYLLKHMQDLFLAAKVPNLRYMVMNDFNMQKDLDFFKC